MKCRSLLVLLLLLAATSCARSEGSTSATPVPGRESARGRGAGGGAVPVTTTKAEMKPVPVTLPAVGTVEAISSVQVRAQVSGQLTNIHFSEGQEVTKGQLLFTIDPRPFEAALQQAQAALARDTATATNQQAQQKRYQ